MASRSDPGSARSSSPTGPIVFPRTGYARLEALPGWLWNPHSAAWEVGFSTLERFVAREGHARVFLSHVEDGYPLGTWGNSQRKRYRKGRLAPDRVARLEALRDWTWDPPRGGRH